jgi:hypothetical protein
MPAYVHTLCISTVDFIVANFLLCSCSMMPTVLRRERPVKHSVPVHVDFVCVGGRYRVGKLLGSGGSGESNSYLSSIQLSERSSECVFWERHQDRS